MKSTIKARKSAADNARLGELFGGRDRFRLLRTLYATPHRRFTNQQLAFESGVAPSNTHKWLKSWADVGLVRRTVDGRNVLYQAADDPLLHGLTDIMLRGNSLLTDIAAALPANVDAVIFGSVARGEEHADSDVDVLVFGKGLSSLRVNAALKAVGRKHNRVIRATVHSHEEFRKMLRDGDSFALGVVENPTIPVKGVFPYDSAHAR